MKKRIYSTIVPIVLLLFTAISCRGPEGPVGPPGYDAEVTTLFYSIQPRDWVRLQNDPHRWIDARQSNLITQDIIDYGAVFFYMQSINGDDYWTLLPLTTVDYDKNGDVYSTEYQPWYGLYDLEMQFYDSHPTDPLPPDWNVNIKVVIISGSDYFINEVKLLPPDDHDKLMEYVEKRCGTIKNCRLSTK